MSKRITTYKVYQKEGYAALSNELKIEVIAAFPYMKCLASLVFQKCQKWT